MKFCWHDWEVVEDKWTSDLVDELQEYNYHNLKCHNHQVVDAFGYTFSLFSNLHEDTVCLKCGTCRKGIETAKMKIIKFWKLAFKKHGKRFTRVRLAKRMWKDKCR